jgi:hypothetical protein
MKNLPLLAILCFAVMGCDISRFVNKGETSNSTANLTTTPEAKPSPSISPTPKPTPAAPSLVTFLKKSVGKYPYEIKLMENPELKSRLKKLLGKDYAAMDENFDVQAPLEVMNDVLMTTGCEAHNCGANQYLLFVDLKSDNINVFHITDDETKHYFEHGEIRLPKKFADQVTTPD